MKSIKETLKRTILSGFVLSLLLAGTVAAHVTVKPSEVIKASFTTFSVNVPNERELATTEVKLLIPENLTNVTPTVKTGWHIAVESTELEGQGDAHNGTKVTSITWTGGFVPTGQRDEFSFSAKTPADTGELIWKAYQTYADGVVVAWDKTADEQPKREDGSPDFSAAGPFSVTTVVDKVAAENTVASTSSDADRKVDRAFYTAIAAVVIALIGLIFATRPDKHTKK